MILQALKEYYDRKPELPREGVRSRLSHGRPGGPSLPFHGRDRWARRLIRRMKNAT